MKVARPAVLVLPLALTMSCVSSAPRLERPTIPADTLQKGAALGIADGALPPVTPAAEVLGVSPAMLAFLQANVELRGSDNLKVRQLAGAIVGAETFGLEYDEHTRTASETFRQRRGNCLSFSIMFVAMARAAGLDVQFQEVDIPPDWSLENDTFVLSRHVNVFVDLAKAGTVVVDFNTSDFRTSYDLYRIPDTLALAQYYNNIGVERMQAGDTAAALANFRRAMVGIDHGFSPAWTNLGTLYLRHGLLDYAESAYLQALRADSGNLVAMSNLARLYEGEGDRERAAEYRRRVIHHRMGNPYYRYQLARDAFAAGEYDAAIGHLRFAVAKKKNDDRFYSLMGLCYLRKGNERAARRWLARARDVAASETLKRHYSSKLDALLHGR